MSTHPLVATRIPCDFAPRWTQNLQTSILSCGDAFNFGEIPCFDA